MKMRYTFLLAILFFGLNASAQSSTVTSVGPDKAGVYDRVETMPVLGYQISDYMQSNLKYPAEAMKAKVEGKVIVKFIVNEDGRVSDCSVIKGIGSGCDEEALRVVKNMPAWKTPAMKDGKPVKVYFKLPILFRQS